MKTLTLSLAAAALAVGGMAYAQTNEHERPARDAAMTQQQVTAMADSAFQRLDANADGKLDEADRAARKQKMFARLDADSNGSVTLAEFQTAREDRGEQRAERGRRGGMDSKHHGRMTGAADGDKDGAITQAEFRSAALARFEAADANKDGTVTPDERRSGRGGSRGMARTGPTS